MSFGAKSGIAAARQRYAYSLTADTEDESVQTCSEDSMCQDGAAVWFVVCACAGMEFAQRRVLDKQREGKHDNIMMY